MARWVGFAVLICVLVMPFTLAASPFKGAQGSTAGELLTIQIPGFSFQKSGSAFDIHVHVFNNTGYFVSNTTTNCSLHLYNESGEHVIRTAMTYDGILDFEVESIRLNASGLYTYSIFCVSTLGRGGFATDSFYVTATGHDDNNSDLTPLAALLIGVFLISVFFGIGAHQFKDDEEHQILSYALFIFGALFALFGLVLGMYFGGQFYGHYVGLDSNLSFLMWGFAGLLTVIVSYWIIYLIVVALAWKNFKKSGGGQ
jgi:hypothetical protein